MRMTAKMRLNLWTNSKRVSPTYRTINVEENESELNTFVSKNKKWYL